MRKMMKALLALTLIAAMLCGSALAAGYGAKVLSDSMPVYGYSDGSKVKLGALDQGTSFKVTDISGDWAKISYKGKTGYARLENIIFDGKIKAISNRDAAFKFVTKASYAKNTYYTATLAANTIVYVVGKDGDNALITNADRTALGYVKLSALTKA